jgi:Uma2 family endonuclease
MSALPKITYITAEEYLFAERNATEKSEYFQGEIFMMAGASPVHNRINENLSVEVGIFLKGKSCQSFSRDMKLHIPENTLYTYPDLMVVCGKPELPDPEEGVVLNPVLIAEILSKSTAGYDRGEKFELYRQIPSFREYLLIDSRKVKAEVWLKNEADKWTLVQETNCLKDDLWLHSISLTLSFEAVYANVDFAENQS